MIRLLIPSRLVKSLSFALVFGAFASQALAQAPITQKMRLQTATVFLRGAELVSTGLVTLPAGESEVILTQVARNISLPSLLISTDNGVVVQSSKPQNDFLEENVLSPKAKEIKDQLEKAEQQRSEWQIQKSVAEEQLAIIAGNRKLSTDKNNATAAEVSKMLDLVEKRMAGALSVKTKINERLVKLDEEIGKLTQQFEAEKGENSSPGGQISVKLYAPKATTSKISISYVVPDAAWSPVYDFRVSKLSKPVNLVYRALLLQQTGLDWKNVRLTLSTGNPGQRTQAPVLSPAFLRLVEPASRAPQRKMSAPYASAPAANFEVDAPLDAKPGQLRQKALDNFVVTNAEGINTTFEIALPYSIPSDGKTHVVLIKSTDLESNYRYVSSPKLEPSAFLQGEISDWESLDILPGKTSIYFENSFVGEGYIDPQQRRGQTLDIGLGRDNNVLIRREINQNFKQKAEFFGGRIAQKYAYTITAKNTRNEAITLDIFDQVPVSRHSEIRIEELKYEGASHQAETGELKWTVSLAAHEEKELSFSYTVTYPKDKPVLGL